MPFDMSCVWWNFDLKDLYVFFPLSWTPIINITQKIPRLLSGLPNNEQLQYVHQFAAFLKHNVKGKCAISYLKQKEVIFFSTQQTFLHIFIGNSYNCYLYVFESRKSKGVVTEKTCLISSNCINVEQ